MANFLTNLFHGRLGDAGPTIPVLRLSGAIMSGGSPLRPALNLATCAEQLEKAFSMKKAPAVAIIVNSPGGSPVQSHLIYKRIRALAVENNKKVYVFIEDAAASGGYMIACAGDEIIADPSSIVGSIGVVSASFGFVEAIDKLGVERRVHTAGQNKSVLDPFLPEKERDIERLKELQLNIHGMFIDLVKGSRGTKLADHDDLFTGLFWTGVRAQELGLVDGIGDVRSTLRAAFGDDMEMKLIEAKKGLFGRKSALGIALGEAVADRFASSTLATLDARALWNRIGL